MANTFQVDNTKIAEIISLLTAVYNTPDEQQYLRAKNLLATAAAGQATLNVVRGDKLREEPPEFYSTGLPWLDTWMGGGVRKSEVIIVGGIPFIGKTHLLAWLGGRLLLEGAKVVHFNGEDVISDIRDIYRQAVGKKAMNRLWLVDMLDYNFTVQQVEDVIDQLERAKSKPDVIVLDHLDVMRSSARTGADWEDATSVIRETKILSKRQDVISIVGSQLHEKTSERKGMRRFYRATIGKQANADIIFMVDDVIDNEYYISREKARARKVNLLTKEKVLEVDWNKMSVEDVT